MCCDLLKIHYLCGDKDNSKCSLNRSKVVVICSKFITFAVTKTTCSLIAVANSLLWFAQNSLPLRWQRQPFAVFQAVAVVVICSKFITFAVTKTTSYGKGRYALGCDLLKIHYLCGDKDNAARNPVSMLPVVICSKFITFAVTKTTAAIWIAKAEELWFAQNSLPLRWQRQQFWLHEENRDCCDLLKIHYLCGDKDNINLVFSWESEECRMC